MSLRTKVSSALLVSAALLSPSLFADAGQFYVAPGLQFMDFDDGTGLGDDTGYSIGFVYDLNFTVNFHRPMKWITLI